METYFIAIKIPEEIEKKIKEKTEGRFNNAFIGKEVAMGNHHLIIKSYGNLTDDSLEELIERLSTVEFEGFDLRMGRLDFIQKKFAGNLWISFKSDRLNQLVKTIWGTVGWSDNRFKPHVTLYKVKKTLDAPKVKAIANSIRFGGISFKVDKFALMKSEALPTGARYSVVEEFSLE